MIDMHKFSMSDSDFSRLEEFMSQNYGINLKGKKQLAITRLAHPLSQLGFNSFTEFLDHFFATKSQQDLELVINKLTTNYTFFMRENQHFSFFQNELLPLLAQKHKDDRVLSIWSAGCSSGEEAYNLSMCIKDFFGSAASRWDTRILATDISVQALTKAKSGVFDKPENMPQQWFERYFAPVKDTNQYIVTPEIRNNVIFRHANLMDNISFRKKFDVIFCRNVMIYFDGDTREALVEKFYNALSPGGYLFISHSESIKKNTYFKLISPAVYQRL